MSIYNHIKDLLRIKDENIKIDDKYYIQKKIKQVDSNVLKGTLTYHATKCDKCGSKNNGNIVKNGFKECKIKLLNVGVCRLFYI